MTSYSKETIAEGASTLITYYNEWFGITDNNFFQINEDYIEDCVNAIIKGIKVNNIRDIEYLVETYNYSFEEVNKKTFKLFDKNEDFEKSKTLGYFSTEMQHYNVSMNTFKNLSKESVSISKLSELLLNSKEIFKIKDHPVSRLVMEINWTSEFGDFFNDDQLYIDEIALLREQAIEFHVDNKTLSLMKFKNNISLLDLIKFQRFMNFLRYAFNKKIEECKKLGIGFVFQSIIPVINYERLVEVVNYIFKDIKKTRIIIDMLTWDDKANEYDMQSLPFIKGENSLAYGINILGSSNLFRNFCFERNERIEINKEILENILIECFKQYTNKLVKTIDFKFNKIKGDIDFIAKIGHKIYIAECKNSLFGTNLKEIRTNYEHLEKGNSQLHKIKNLLKDSKFRQYVSDKSNIDILDEDEIVSFIVSGNRNFYGTDIFDFNVFPLYTK